jgi:hypothetical protein
MPKTRPAYPEQFRREALELGPSGPLNPRCRAAIIGGVLVFHDAIGAGALAVSARFLAFCLVIAGAALMPAPTRAADTA